MTPAHNEARQRYAPLIARSAEQAPKCFAPEKEGFSSAALTFERLPGIPPALLVVEDDADDFMLLKRALYKTGATARVWWARDAEEALTILDELDQATAQICVVMDLRMAGSDGWDLLGKIRSRPHSHAIKCALLTGMADPNTRGRAQLEGADAFFIKPCGTAGLKEIARALQTLAVS